MDYFKLKKMYNSNSKFAKITKALQKQPQFKLDQMLLEAIAEGDEFLFEFLLGCGASINAQNKMGETALMYACHYANLQIVQTLIDAGAALNKTAKIAFSYQMDTSNPALTSTLFGNNLKYSDAVSQRHRCSGVNALMYAAASRMYADSLPVTKQLLQTGQFNINQQDADGFSALMYAVEAGNVQVAQYLIANGANVNTQDKYGNTAIMYALNRMYSKFMVKLLVVNGADLKVKNKFGENAEDMAKRNQARMGVKWLDQAKHFKELYKDRPTFLKVTPDELERE